MTLMNIHDTGYQCILVGKGRVVHESRRVEMYTTQRAGMNDGGNIARRMCVPLVVSREGQRRN